MGARRWWFSMRGAATLTKISGDSNACLAARHFMGTNSPMRRRDHAHISTVGIERISHNFKEMMLRVFYPMPTPTFLKRHNGHQDRPLLVQLGRLQHVLHARHRGAVRQDETIYDEAVDYFKHGKRKRGDRASSLFHSSRRILANGRRAAAIRPTAMMGVGLLATFCQMAWNQGDDLYGYDNNRLLAGAEYVAKYNLGEDVPYQLYKNSLETQPEISSYGRGGTAADMGNPLQPLREAQGTARAVRDPGCRIRPARRRRRGLWSEQRQLRHAWVWDADVYVELGLCLKTLSPREDLGFSDRA